MSFKLYWPAKPCGLTFTFPPIDRGRRDRLFRRGIAGFNGRLLNTKYVDANARLNMRRGKHIRDYAEENPSLICG